MDVKAVEMGNRPLLMTKARRFAPAGAKVLGELLGDQTWADYAWVVLDWENETKSQPDDSHKPILVVQVHKLLPEYTERNHLTIEVTLDVEDIFGGDNMTAESILNIVHELRMKVDEQVAMRKES